MEGLRVMEEEGLLKENAETIVRELLDLDNDCDFVLIELDTIRGNYSDFVFITTKLKQKQTNKHAIFLELTLL